MIRTGRTALAWSGGKDSTLALARLLGDPGLEIVALLTTITEDFDRISMHGVRRELLHAQAAALGLPLLEVPIRAGADNAHYESRMATAVSELARREVTEVAFGDLYLADVRAYRERQMATSGMKCIFPLWGEDTAALARRFVAEDYRALTVCVDPRQLSGDWVGRDLDARFFDELPAGVDPCGENGEFHTFVWDGPIFRHPVTVARGERVLRDGFWFCDLLRAA